MFNVVFEYTNKAGGYAGNRFIVGYKDKAEFDKSGNDPSYTKVLDEGVSDNKAQDLVSLTPQICRVTAAIQEACYNEDKVDVRMLDYQLSKQLFGIRHDFIHRVQHSLTSIKDFEKLVVGSDGSDKNRLYQCALRLCDNPYGMIDLDKTIQVLLTEAKKLVKERKK